MSGRERGSRWSVSDLANEKECILQAKVLQLERWTRTYHDGCFGRSWRVEWRLDRAQARAQPNRPACSNGHSPAVDPLNPVKMSLSHRTTPTTECSSRANSSPLLPRPTSHPPARARRARRGWPRPSPAWRQPAGPQRRGPGSAPPAAQVSTDARRTRRTASHEVSVRPRAQGASWAGSGARLVRRGGGRQEIEGGGGGGGGGDLPGPGVIKQVMSKLW